MADFGQFLQDPRLLGFALQSGLGMMQPPAWGDTFGSQFARSIGQGAEAVGRGEVQELKEEDLASKAALRGAQAEAAEARAGAAGSRLGAAADRLGVARERLQLDREKLEQQRQLGGIGKLLQAQRNHQSEAKRAEMSNLLLPPAQQKPFPPFRDWLGQQGMTDVIDFLEGRGGRMEEVGGSQRERTPEARGTGLPSGSSAQYPTAVRGQTDRPPGIYNLNGTPMRWTGTNWEDL